MEKVEWNDVQGLVLSGYPKLPFSAYVLWRFRPQQLVAARQWLSALAERLMRAGAAEAEANAASAAGASAQPPTHLGALKHAEHRQLRAVNLALTSHGLHQLEVGDAVLKNFSLEFLEGMAPKPDQASGIPRRSNVLGDLGDSLPDKWDWGGWAANGDVDGVLLLFAADAASLQSLLDDELKAMAMAAEPIGVGSQDSDGTPALKGRIFDDRKEHFGYTDGISQPIIEGSPKSQRGEHSDADERIHVVKPGEFILGYLNERRVRATASDGAKDLRRNGSYLVLRQLEQDVEGFNDFVAQAAAGLPGDEDDDKKRQWVAARLVGRFPSGKPLASPPANSKSESADHTKDPVKEHSRHKSGNDFLYYFEDRFGLQCPVGAHIRRANPRDTKGPDPDTALRLAKMHRILRRGRMYGERLDPAKPDSGNGRRGILFLCLNADIAGQFEMIQHSWLNNRHFGDLYVGTDPLGHSAADGGTIVIQRQPTNLVLQRPKPFVRVRGGAYFFLPGIAAVKALAR
jgi:Dyp-type peroxidase family